QLVLWYGKALEAISPLLSVIIVASPSALTRSSRPDQVACRVVFLSWLSSSCLRNSRPMNSTSVSSNGPTEGIRISPWLRVACQCAGCIRHHGTVVHVGSRADTLKSCIDQLN